MKNALTRCFSNSENLQETSASLLIRWHLDQARSFSIYNSMIAILPDILDSENEFKSYSKFLVDDDDDTDDEDDLTPPLTTNFFWQLDPR